MVEHPKGITTYVTLVEMLNVVFYWTNHNSKVTPMLRRKVRTDPRVGHSVNTMNISTLGNVKSYQGDVLTVNLKSI